MTDEQPTAAIDEPVPNPVGYDDLIIRVDVELGPERIRATRVVPGFGPDKPTSQKIHEWRDAFERASRELWDAARAAEWGLK